ncbi:MAG TPA: DNA alkylation repair protein [Candidatus Paceibacterota bacterium]|nr:DNA alkylation repair protein [Candidatus Paceibacterota bacterium]
MTTAVQAKRILRQYRSVERAIGAARFFKTEKGEYGYGDVFIGVTVPDTRKVAKQFSNLPLNEIGKLLMSKIHEDRLLALIILVIQFEHGDERTRRDIYRFYIAKRSAVDNWDLVDTSASRIVGSFLLNHHRERSILTKLALSDRLWDRRIAVIATLAFIEKKSSAEIFMLARMLIDDPHDLMHKAIGWMLREVGKRIGRDEECKFLDVYASKLPRTALRYALEHFEPPLRDHYMKKRIP